MVKAHLELVSALNDLIETCKDNEEGFRHAAEYAENGKLRSLFEVYSREAARAAAELETELRRVGGTPRDANIHDDLFTSPGWVIITNKLTGEGEAALLAECECGVNAAEKGYVAALAKGLPDEVRSRIERQHAELKEMTARIHALAGRHWFGPPQPSQERQEASRRARELDDGPPAS
jgi:uncharacterized protein (TIGR02284 family)